MKRLLYQIHRWAGIALALFMFMWFVSGLVIMYAGPSALGAREQLAHREALHPQAGWLSLGEAWSRSAAARLAAQPGTRHSEDAVVEARLVNVASHPMWLVQDSRDRRMALSALTGALVNVSKDQALSIAAQWVAEGSPTTSTPVAGITYLDLGPQDSSVRNYEALRPFHRVAVGESGRELLISARTGEVVRDSTALSRTAYWAGNWIHLLRPLEAAGMSADNRRLVQTWLGFVAFAACLTGMIIGWQRWRPGFAGRPTYSQGRTHPYRDFWNRWHFWAGLIGGSAALLWALSGFVSTNPLKVFSPANPSRAELARYQLSSSAQAVPWALQEGKPFHLLTSSPQGALVELAWHRLGNDVVLLGLTRDGQRQMLSAGGASAGLDANALRQAVQRLAGSASIANATLQSGYDSYYYPRHHQDGLERPLTVWRFELSDAGQTRYYIDPLDGRLLLRQDQSRRIYRWLYSALHHWDVGWLYQRPLWDAWMLPLVLLGLVLGASSVVLGYKRLRIKFGGRQRVTRPAAGVRAGPSMPVITS